MIEQNMQTIGDSLGGLFSKWDLESIYGNATKIIRHNRNKRVRPLAISQNKPLAYETFGGCGSRTCKKDQHPLIYCTCSKFHTSFMYQKYHCLNNIVQWKS